MRVLSVLLLLPLLFCKEREPLPDPYILEFEFVFSKRATAGTCGVFEVWAETSTGPAKIDSTYFFGTTAVGLEITERGVRKSFVWMTRELDVTGKIRARVWAVPATSAETCPEQMQKALSAVAEGKIPETDIFEGESYPIDARELARGIPEKTQGFVLSYANPDTFPFPITPKLYPLVAETEEKALICGGVSTDRMSPTEHCEILDKKRFEVRQVQPLSHARVFGAICSLGELVVISGGLSRKLEPLPYVEVFDMEEERFVRIFKVRPRFLHHCIEGQTKLVLLGGLDGSGIWVGAPTVIFPEEGQAVERDTEVLKVRRLASCSAQTKDKFVVAGGTFNPAQDTEIAEVLRVSDAEAENFAVSALQIPESGPCSSASTEDVIGILTNYGVFTVILPDGVTTVKVPYRLKAGRVFEVFGSFVVVGGLVWDGFPDYPPRTTDTIFVLDGFERFRSVKVGRFLMPGAFAVEFPNFVLLGGSGELECGEKGCVEFPIIIHKRILVRR